MKRIVIIFVFALVIIIFIPIVPLVFPDSIFTGLIKQYSDSSSLIIAVLTMAYVITNILQYNNMKNQLNMMENNLKLQVQPLPIPEQIKFNIEKIRPFVGPETDFANIIIMHRIHSSIILKNSSYGMPISIKIFPSLIIDSDLIIPQPYIDAKHIGIISENKESACINIMFFDDKQKILEAFIQRKNIQFQIEMIYKNIFGAAFFSRFQYDIRISRESYEALKNNYEYIINDLPKFKTDLEKHRVLRPIDSEEASEIFQKIKKEIENKNWSDIEVAMNNDPSECEVEIVEYKNKFEMLNKKYNYLVEKYYKPQYDMFMKWKEHKEE